MPSSLQEAGWIEVNLKPDSSWVVVEVKDTGPGITPEDQLVLFERFRPGSHKRSGSGLGLHLSRRIVEAHQGKIEVQSAIGRGSSFIVYLPAQGLKRGQTQGTRGRGAGGEGGIRCS